MTTANDEHGKLAMTAAEKALRSFEFIVSIIGACPRCAATYLITTLVSKLVWGGDPKDANMEMSMARLNGILSEITKRIVQDSGGKIEASFHQEDASGAPVEAKRLN